MPVAGGDHLIVAGRTCGLTKIVCTPTRNGAACSDSALMSGAETDSGVLVWEAFRILGWLLELKRSEGVLEEEEIFSRLDEWWEQNRARYS